MCPAVTLVEIKVFNKIAGQRRDRGFACMLSIWMRRVRSTASPRRLKGGSSFSFSFSYLRISHPPRPPDENSNTSLRANSFTDTPQPSPHTMASIDSMDSDEFAVSAWFNKSVPTQEMTEEQVRSTRSEATMFS